MTMTGQVSLTAGALDFADRFWSQVDTSGEECWLWQGKINSDGYGVLTGDGVNGLAHRLAYTLSKGALGSHHVLHECDVPACCRPEHLRAGTAGENTRDMFAKGRNVVTQVGEAHHAAKLTEQDVRDIRRRYLEGGISYAKLAREYSLSASAVGLIVQRINWKNVI